MAHPTKKGLVVVRSPRRDRSKTSANREIDLELARRIRAGDRQAAAELVKKYDTYAHQMAVRYHYRTKLELDDLYQEARIGLITAVEKYDPDLGYAFLTYAAWWVQNSLAHYCSDFGRTIRVPVNAQEKYRKLRRADQLDEVIGSEADIVRAMQFIMLPIDPLYVYGTVADVEDFKLGAQAETFLTDMIHHREKIARINAALARLPEIWREVLKIRFLEEQTLKDTGKILHERGITPRRLTRERIRQIEFKAKRKLQQILLETKE